jgi:hypothetical protein
MSDCKPTISYLPRRASPDNRADRRKGQGGAREHRAAPEVHRFRRHQHPNARRSRDHVAALTARSTIASVAASIPGAMRTVAAPITISIGKVLLPWFGATGASGLGRADEDRSARLAPVVSRLSPGPPSRLAPPTEQLLRHQPVSPRNNGNLLAALIAFADNLPLLPRAPRTPSAGA